MHDDGIVKVIELFVVGLCDASGEQPKTYEILALKKRASDCDRDSAVMVVQEQIDQQFAEDSSSPWRSASSRPDSASAAHAAERAAVNARKRSSEPTTRRLCHP